VVNGIRRNALHKSQLYGFASEHPHGPVIMPIGNRATGKSDHMGGLLACQGLPPSLLHLIMQHQVEPAFRKAMGHILDRGWRNCKRLGNLGFVPPVSQFQQGPGSCEGARIRLALTHKLLGLGTLSFA
jgi:hypothetical protein